MFADFGMVKKKNPSFYPWGGIAIIYYYCTSMGWLNGMSIQW
jgi:hypothetical protein